MDCVQAREAMSAVMDGETSETDESRAMAHVRGCAGCQAWSSSAYDVTRRARMTGWNPPVELPDFAALAQAPAPVRLSWLPRVRAVLLAAAAVGQLVLTVALLGGTADQMGRHGDHELGIFDLSLAVAFAVGALRPRLAAGLAWPAGAAAAGLLATAAADVIDHNTFEVHELTHLIAVGGAVLLCWTAWDARRSGPRGVTTHLKHGGVRRPRSTTARLTAMIVVTAVTVLLGAGVAAAHVTVNPSSVAPNSEPELSFRAPNETAKANFTKLVVHFPAATPLASVSPRPLSGWSISSTKAPLPRPIVTDDGTVTEYLASVTWIATAGGIAPEQYQDFVVSAGPLPASGTLTFTVEQTYSDGSVVRWDQLSKPGAAEPENPAPVLTIAAPETGPKDGPDGAALGLSIGALAVAIVAAVLAGLGLRRRREFS